MEGRVEAAGTELCDDACLVKVLGGDFEASDRGTEKEIFMSLKADSVAYTYGTIAPPGVRTVLDHIKFDSSDVFTDVGSGVGNVVLQIYANTPIRRVRGIEYIKARHDDAVRHVGEFKKLYKIESKELLLVNGDACKEDYSDSTIVFASSTTFPPELMDCFRKTNEANPRLRYLITQKPLGPTKLRYLGDLTTVDTSWSDGEPYRIYTNVPDVELTSKEGVEMVRP